MVTKLFNERLDRRLGCDYGDVAHATIFFFLVEKDDRGLGAKINELESTEGGFISGMEKSTVPKRLGCVTASPNQLLSLLFCPNAEMSQIQGLL